MGMETTELGSAEQVKRLLREAWPDCAGPLEECQRVWTASSGQWGASLRVLK